MFFKDAKRQGLMDNNPFEFVRHRPGDASERRAYVPVADIERVIEHAPNTAWKLLIALSRFAGLRVPSEALSLRWQDVDWERGRLTVPRPKTEHLAGRSHRVIPLFPKLRPFLEVVFDEADAGTEHIITRYRNQNSNLRTYFLRIIKRAGIQPWPKLFHNLRATRQTELAARHPLHVVCEWLGNSAPIADKHYLQVTDQDYASAIAGPTNQSGAESGTVGAHFVEKTAQNPAQQPAAPTGTAWQKPSMPSGKRPLMRKAATTGEVVQLSISKSTP